MLLRALLVLLEGRVVIGRFLEQWCRDRPHTTCPQRTHGFSPTKETNPFPGKFISEHLTIGSDPQLRFLVRHCSSSSSAPTPIVGKSQSTKSFYHGGAVVASQFSAQTMTSRLPFHQQNTTRFRCRALSPRMGGMCMRPWKTMLGSVWTCHPGESHPSTGNFQSVKPTHGAC